MCYLFPPSRTFAGRGPIAILRHVRKKDLILIRTLYSYTTPKEDVKNINHVTHRISSADISSFSPEISKFCYVKKYRYKLHFDT